MGHPDDGQKMFCNKRMIFVLKTETVKLMTSYV
jgi:hypothetical protein